jgi:hypothetical protein
MTAPPFFGFGVTSRIWLAGGPCKFAAANTAKTVWELLSIYRNISTCHLVALMIVSGNCAPAP